SKYEHMEPSKYYSMGPSTLAHNGVYSVNSQVNNSSNNNDNNNNSNVYNNYSYNSMYQNDNKSDNEDDKNLLQALKTMYLEMIQAVSLTTQLAQTFEMQNLLTGSESNQSNQWNEFTTPTTSIVDARRHLSRWNQMLGDFNKLKIPTLLAKQRNPSNQHLASTQNFQSFDNTNVNTTMENSTRNEKNKKKQKNI
ncbi:hypothetical protein RFI_10201, partial [Reticulomyxa filosa]